MLRPFLDHSWVDEVVDLDWYTARKSAPPRRIRLAEGVAEQLSLRWAHRFGVESLGLGSLAASRLCILDSVIRKLRRAKDPDELALIRRSVRAGEAAHAAAIAQIRPGLTELDAFLVVQAAAIRELGEQVLVYGDFVSGPRCENEQGDPPSHRVIKRGDLFLLDFSVVVHGYRADFTNTFVVGGDPRRGRWSCTRFAWQRSRPARRCCALTCRQRRSTPWCAAISPPTGSTAISPRTPGMGWAWGIPNRPTLFRRASRRSRPTTWSHSNRGFICPESGGCGSSATT